MHSLVTSSSVEGASTVSRRNRTMMCSQCRHDKQRCDPVDRNWDELQQKCRRCSKLGYDCGPSKRAQRRSRKTSPAISTEEIHYSEQTLSWANYMNDSSNWSPLSWGDPGSQNACHQTTSLGPESSVIQSMKTDLNAVRDHGSSYNPTGIRAGDSIAKLGDLNAARELLRWDLGVCDQVENWLGSSDHGSKLRAAINGVIYAIQEDFEQCIKNTRCIVAGEVGSVKEKTMLELYLIAYRFANPPLPVIAAQNSDIHGSSMLQQSSLQNMVHTLRENTFTYSDADFICGTIWNSTPYTYPASTESAAGVVGSYQKASAAIARVLSETVLRKFEHRELLFGPTTGVNPDTDQVSGYPPSHLAMMHGSLPVIFKLLTNSTLQMWELDCLQRTPIHVAAYAGRMHELQCIFDHDILAAVHAGQDIFGLTPLMIAACKDDVKAFTLLLRHGADYTVKDLLDRNLLTLAARNGSQGVMKILLRHSNIPPSSPPDFGELCEAIRHERRDIVCLLIGHYDKSGIINDSDLFQIKAGIITARQKGFCGIAEALENVESCQPPRVDAIDCYGQLGSAELESYLSSAGCSDHEWSTSIMGSMTVEQYSRGNANVCDLDLCAAMPFYQDRPSYSSTRKSSTRPSSTVTWS